MGRRRVSEVVKKQNFAFTLDPRIIHEIDKRIDPKIGNSRSSIVNDVLQNAFLSKQKMAVE